MLVMIFVTRSEEQKRRVIQDAMDRHVRFLDVFSTEGHVEGGNITPMEPDITLEDIERNLMIGSPEEVTEKLGLYFEQDIDEMQLNFSFGTPHGEIMNSIEDFMTRVVPQFE
jgi:alkanesulfonate monooxygenase SsuD/methylene tetrahydromethanopterin reductase-like flavin-dependent oxidoreductase (luciferase family)